VTAAAWLLGVTLALLAVAALVGSRSRRSLPWDLLDAPVNRMQRIAGRRRTEYDPLEAGDVEAALRVWRSEP